MKRRVGMFLIFAAILPLAVTSVAWACGVLATASSDKKVAAPGETITITGRNYAAPDPDRNPTPSAITIRLNSRTGPVLTTFAPASSFTKPVVLPSNLSPGWYVIVVTQLNTNLTPKAGTPGRTTVRVQGTAASTVAGSPWGKSAPPVQPLAQAPDAGSSPLLAMLLAIALSLTMLVGGWTLVARKGRLSSSTPLAT